MTAGFWIGLIVGITLALAGVALLAMFCWQTVSRYWAGRTTFLSHLMKAHSEDDGPESVGRIM